MSATAISRPDQTSGRHRNGRSGGPAVLNRPCCIGLDPAEGKEMHLFNITAWVGGLVNRKIVQHFGGFKGQEQFAHVLGPSLQDT